MVREQGKMGRVLMVAISIVIIALSGLSGTSSVWAQSVKAYVDRNPVMADETFQLVVETETASSGESPDWHVLDENFDVLGTAQSQQTSIVNFRTTSLVRWIATLAPKRTGALTIPSIHVGAHQSDPIQLTVNEPTRTNEAHDSREIFLEAEVDSRVPYLQGQVLLTLRLVSAVSVQEGRLDEPDIDWGIVERVGKDASYESTRNGRRYRITERRYVITPQKSGAHVIPPVLFSGTVEDGRTRGTLFEELFGNRSGRPGRDAFQASRSIHRRSPKILLTVNDLPPDLNGRVWLPAKDLTLTETWSADTETLQMGDPLTRTVVIRAKGQRGDQLPELVLPPQAILKVYPDKAKTQTDFDGTWVLGSREEQYVLVPTQPGTVTLPAIHVPWWNIETARWEEARLPARALTVLGHPQSVSSEPGALSFPAPSDPPVGIDRPAMESLSPPKIPMSDSGVAVPWPWIAGGFLAMWLVTLAAWWRDRHKRNGSGSMMVRKDDEKLESERKAIQAVKAACLAQSAEKTRAALLQWASIKQKGRPCLSLGRVAHILSQPVPDPAEIAAAIWNLDRTLYTTSAGQQTWDGRLFWETVKPALTAKPRKSEIQENVLPPLYLHSGHG
jgi:hypothetical protein